MSLLDPFLTHGCHSVLGGIVLHEMKPHGSGRFLGMWGFSSRHPKSGLGDVFHVFGRACSNTCSFLLGQELQGSVMFGAIEGGDILEERLRSARETAKRPVGGFLLDGFQGSAMAKETKLKLIASVTAELPEDKPR